MQRKIGLLLFVGALVVAACGGDGETTVGSGDTTFSGKGGEEFCQKARDFEKNTKDTGDATSPEGLREEFGQLSAAIDDLVDAAPGEIKADTKAVGDYFGRVRDLYERHDYDQTKIPEEEAATLDSGTEKTKAASERVQSYFEKVCNIDTDGDGDTDGVKQEGAPPTTAADAPDAGGEPPAGTEPSETTAPE